MTDSQGLRSGLCQTSIDLGNKGMAGDEGQQKDSSATIESHEGQLTMERKENV